MYEVVLLLPRIYEPEEIDMQSVLGLMERMYANG